MLLAEVDMLAVALELAQILYWGNHNDTHKVEAWGIGCLRGTIAAKSARRPST